MLADKLRAATAGGAIPIEYVGGYVEGFAGTTSDVTISLTSLTGGLDSAPSTGDLVVVYFGVGTTDGDLTLQISGYTEVAKLFANDSYDTNLLAAYKIMGATPDTDFILVGGTDTSGQSSGVVAVQVWRNVDETSPLDVSATTATGTNSVLCDPPAITPSTEGAFIISGGAGAHTSGTQTFTSSNLTGFITVGYNSVRDATVGIGYHEWTSGSFDPAQFGFTGSDSTSNSWAAVTMALRPA